MADEAWTLLKRIKTVAAALKDFREVRIEAGTAEEASASKHPALVIRLMSIEETAYEDITQVVSFDLDIILKKRGEESRVQELIEVSNDLKNALEGDAIIKGYIADWPSLEPRDAENPYEHWGMSCTGKLETTRTGR